MIRYCTFLILSLFILLHTNGQRKKSQVALSTGFGSSSVIYTPTMGETKGGGGVNFSIDYRYFFSPNIGVLAGIKYISYKGSISIMSDSLSAPAVDPDGEDFIFNSYYRGWEENQKINQISIPIEFLYHHPLNDRLSILGGAGVCFGFITSAEQWQSSGVIKTTGYFPSLGYAFEDVPAQGFDTYKFEEVKKLDASFNLSLVADAGVSCVINPYWSIYGGLFVDYGVTNMAMGGNNPIVTYDANTDPKVAYQGALSSEVVSSAHTLALGAKVTVLFELGSFIENQRTKADEKARLKAEDEALKTGISSNMMAEIKRQTELMKKEVREKQIADSLRKEEELRKMLHVKDITDSIAEQERIKMIEDSINTLRLGGEGKVIIDVRSKLLNREEISMMQLPIDFERGKATITPKYIDNARKIGEILAKHPTLIIGITGYTCDLGSEEINYKLGLQRANSLLEEFVKAGTDRTQITTHSKGELEPLVPNVDEESRQKNRRVVIIISDADNL
ncbi:MAG: OmpA family protein [Breznakibacter sp.]|nr:OmpA family protein [Breznakibacter sp.]